MLATVRSGCSPTCRPSRWPPRWCWSVSRAIRSRERAPGASGVVEVEHRDLAGERARRWSPCTVARRRSRTSRPTMSAVMSNVCGPDIEMPDRWSCRRSPAGAWSSSLFAGDGNTYIRIRGRAPSARRRHVRVAEAREVLGLALDRVAVDAAAPVVVGLRVAGGLVEAGVVVPVVQEVDVVEQLLDRALAALGERAVAVGGVDVEELARGGDLGAEVAGRRIGWAALAGPRPSGANRLRNASTLLPLVSVAPGASHGSFWLNGKFDSVTSLVATNGAWTPSGTATTLGSIALPAGCRAGSR